MIYLRTPEEKANQEAWWERPDEIFFSAGACHILASTFLRLFPEAEFEAVMIKPREGFRGGHVMVTDRKIAIDAHGAHPASEVLSNYYAEMHVRERGWDAQVLTVQQDPASWEFCRTHGYRHPAKKSRQKAENERASRVRRVDISPYEAG